MIIVGASHATTSADCSPGVVRSFLYYLAPAMRPRMLMTLDPEGALLPTPVRVGQAVDVVAQAGRPKAITGATQRVSPAPTFHVARLVLQA